MTTLNRRTFSLALAAPVIAAGDVPKSSFWNDVPHWMEISCVPGAVVAIIENGRLTGIHPFGVRHSGETDAVNAETIFEAASLSKPVFASAVLRLVAANKLDLDRPLHEILQLDPDPRARPITARHILSHSSGLQNWRNKAEDKFDFQFTPGERFSYSGEGYFYLQRVVEKITEKPFAQYMRETVLEPLGMTRSTYLWRDDPNSAGPHNFRGKPGTLFKVRTLKSMADIATEWKKPVETWFYEDIERAMPRLSLPALPNFMLPNAAASLSTTAQDYVKFLIHAFSIEAMRQPQVKINSDLSWGLGAGLEMNGKDRWFWHWGDNSGYKNFFIADAASRSGILVFTNGDGGAKLYQRIVRHALGRDFSAFLWV